MEQPILDLQNLFSHHHSCANTPEIILEKQQHELWVSLKNKNSTTKGFEMNRIKADTRMDVQRSSKTKNCTVGTFA